MNSQLLVGVDGGGSQTRAVVCDRDGNVFGRGASGSSNFYAVGMETTASNIAAAVLQAATMAGAEVQTQPEPSCGFGLAGACSDRDVAFLQAALQPALAPIFGGVAPHITIEEDAVAAWAGAFGGEPGVICIAGTGANSFGIGVNGQRAKTDGVGPIMGDRGSGIEIGRNVLRAASAAFDGVGPATSLLDATLAHFGVDSINALVNHIYAPEFARSDLAGLVPLAAREATNGDAVAQKILEAAGRDLAASVAALLRKLAFLIDKPVLVAPVGGVFDNVGLVRASFNRELETLASQPVTVQPARFEAVVGAALLPLIL